MTHYKRRWLKPDSHPDSDMAKTATKAKKAAPADEAQGKALIAHEIIRSPSIQNDIGMHAWGKFAGEADLSELVRDLQARAEKVQGGDLRQLEAMLFGQAMVLQTAFTNLSRRASSAEYLKQFSVYMGLALKAQAQARSTLEALAEIRNPRPVMFAKQANVTSGNQQINNGTMPDGREIRAGSHAEENPSLQNELLEQQHGNHLDFGTAGAAVGADSHLEAVDAGHRAAHP